MRFIVQCIQCILFSSLLIILPKNASAQIPNTGIYFQAIARDNFSNPAKDRKIYVQSGIIQNNTDKTLVLQEEFQATTDASGIFGISIGLGNRIGGSKKDLQSIEWVNGPYALALKIAIEPIAPVTNWDYTKNWIELGSTPFGTVPYALYSNTSGSISGKLNITDTNVMLLPYKNAINLLQSNTTSFDTIFLRNQFLQKLNYSDTSSMLSGYLRVGAIVPFTGTLSYNDIINRPDLNSKESILNKSTNIQNDASSDLKYPSTKAVKNYIDGIAGNIDNTSDINKPISTLTQAALNLKLAISDTIALSNRINFKEDIENKSINLALDGSSDSKYPSAKAVKTYIDAAVNNINSGNASVTISDADFATKGIIKLNGDIRGSADSIIINANAISTNKIAVGAVTDAKIATGINPSKVGLGNVDNTNDLDKPISTATQAALDLKFNLSAGNSLNTLINSKLNSSDTLSWMNSRIARDTFFLSSRINSKVNLIDSNAIFATPTYVDNKIVDTSFLSNRIDLKYDLSAGINNATNIALKLNKSDTFYLSNRIDNKINSSDSVFAYVTPYSLSQSKFDSTSLSNRIDLKVNTSDTARMLANYAMLSNLSPIATTGNYNDLINKPTLQNSSVTSVNAQTGDIIIDKAAINLGNVDNTTDLNKPISTLTSVALNNKADISLLNAPNGFAGLDGNGKIPSNLLPPISFSSVAIASSAADMISLGTTSTKGTICIRTDLSKSFVLSVDYSALANDWIEILTPGAPVQSINGRTGTVSLSTTDIAEGTNQYFTQTKARNALGANAPLNYSISTGIFSADTLTSVSGLATRGYLLQQLGNTNSSISNKLNVNDTANMLYPYAKSSNINSLFSNKLNLSDTAYMLSNRIGRDTIALSNRINSKINISDTSAMLANYLTNSFTKESLSNKSNDTTLGGILASNTLYPTQYAVKKYIENNAAQISTSIGTSTGTAVDATTTTKGKILLAGDLGGTATLPIVVSVGGKTKEEILAAVNDISTATNSNTANTIVKRDANGNFYGNIVGNATNVTGIVAIANGGTGASSIAGFKTNFGLDNIDNTSDLNKPLSTATTNALSLKINNSAIASANGVASLGADGKIPTAQLPSFSITTVNVVNSQANMLALTGLSVGAVAIRTDNSTNYILTTLPASTLANWQTFYPASTNVQSINGLTGAVALTGTTNRLTISASNIFDIASNYIGQNSINTVGTITTGVWNATAIPITNGGTGATNANAAFNALAPSQSGKNGYFLTTNGTNTSWASVETAGGWSTSGNANLTDGSYYLGTTDAQPLNFKAGNIPSGRIDVSSTIGQTSLGYGAAYNAQRSTTASTYYGTKNTSIGYQANYNSYYGKENTALGYQALFSTFRTSGSTAIGFQAMSNFDNNSASAADFISYNSAIGFQAMQGSATPASNTGTNNTAIGYQALKAMTSGAQNATLGALSLSNNTTGGYNSALGFYALYSNTTGSYNIAIGRYAAYNNTTGTGNIAIGSSALSSNTTGNFNTAIGHSANVTDGLTNAIAIGYNASNSTSNTIQLGNGNITKVNTSGAFVSTNGTNATSTSTGSLIISGGAGISGNTYIGGALNVAGSTTFAGATTFNGGIYALGIYGNTLNNITVQNTSTLSGATNIAGVTTISNATASTASNNGALVVTGGTGIVGALNVGGNTTIAGTTTLNSISYGTTPATNDNSTKIATTAFVMNSLASPNNNYAWSTSGNAGLTDGAYYLGTTDAQPLNFKAGNLPAGRIDVSSIIGQTSLGYGAAYNAQRSTTASTYYGTKNTSIGYQANYNSHYGKENTALGYQALFSTFRTSGSTAIGFQAMSNYNDNLSTATDFISYNSALGYQAMQGSATPASNTGTNNTAIGYQALKAMTSGAQNATVGALSLSNNTTGGYNSALGYYALYSNTTGYNNTAIGNNAMSSNTTGGYNSALGYYALYSNTTGYYNTAIGISAAYNITTGIGNIAIGFNALSSNTTGNFNTAIGHSANVTDGLTNAIAIGYNASNSTSNTIQLGNSAITKLSTYGALVSTNGTNATSTSTGSLIISGGAGISGNAYVGGLLNVASTTAISGATSFSGGITASGTSANTLNNITVQNTSTLSGATNIAGVTTVSNATASTANNNGALIVTGGTGIGGALNVGGNTNISGTTTIAGTTRLNSISYGTTPATNDNSTKIATTAFVMNSLASPNNGRAFSTTGNSGLVDGTNFIGTIDAQPLNIKTNNTNSGRIDVDIIKGQVSFGFGAAAQTSLSNVSPYNGTKNTAIGYQAINTTIIGKENTALGYQALNNNSSGSSSVAIGYQAMSNANNSASTSDFITYNTAIGYQALQGSVTPANNNGTNNTTVGYQSLKANTSGGYNSALGSSVLINNTSGGSNTAIGYNSLNANTTGNYNNALGRNAMSNNLTGTGNIAIGYNALSSNTTGNYNIAVGYGANVSDGLTNAISIGQNATNATSNSIQLGNTSITKVNTSGEITTSSDLVAKHIKGNSSTPSIATSTGAGTSPTGITLAGTDMSGVVTLTTGTSPSINSVLATVTYNSAYSSSPVVVITPANAATASLAAAQAVWVNIGTSNFSINTNATSLNASTTYKWNYVVIQ